MKPSNEALLKEIMADFEKTRDTFLDVQRRLSSLESAVQSPDRTLTVTVDARGELSSLAFRGTGYRALPPARLAELIVTTVQKAQRELRDKARGVAGHLTDGPAATFDGSSWWDLLPGADDPANKEFFTAVRGGTGGPGPGPTGGATATRSTAVLDDNDEDEHQHQHQHENGRAAGTRGSRDPWR
ncbi:YbaB/EbfC family nucleoid-associated protein [Streptomyces sp. NPDC001985]|uniref:YbaB/EbfC family nucleoid-associated protein n=1 Tax=Streptomyces sp. NPDC001985 TaxID=3154406 RepID=UPI003316910F